ncbi:LuxR C-terminal-related transcriptional regulator [Streptomyces guryensis]|uniref:LuxR C-terminal-related transcriptional regulator n=1 Tax=Streptomyces guryensis TaxID=2886947 RepID=A0A9Q3Z7R8_9ACTN|nr:LuxR C-terminal-related transcriptional regulator [Streptomyces guryensis]MCD9874827.1 LuxR C-terminal-related transcriptional regulator [Streptomyces guryensis]
MGAVTPTGDPVLAARFSVPAVPKTFVRRSRLSEQLDVGVRGPLTLVDGPAGAGKTLLVADWVTAGDLPGPAAWLTVEPEDSGPGVFWTYVLQALLHHGIALPDHIGSPARPGKVDHSLLTRLAAWMDGRDVPVIIVLDDFDGASASAEVADELQFVLRHAGDGLRLVIICRAEPLLPLHRYRAAGELVDIRSADLAFRSEETAALVDRHGLPLSADVARLLTERMGGWAAGVRLSALAAERADDPEDFLRDFEAGQSTLADFLLAEVLRAHPAETQDLLLRTSIVEETHPELANALTGRNDAEAILAELQRSNAFVEPIGHSWYRLHPLFAEILRAHLRVRHPGLEPELHRRAAKWLSGAGLLGEALPHAADAGDWDLAATEFIDDLAIGRMLTGLDAERLDGLFAAMTPDASGPATDLVRAARELTRHDVERGFAYLHDAEQKLPDDPRDAAAAQFSCAVLRVLAARVAGSADMAETAAETAAEAARALPADRLEQRPELTALMLTDLGSAQLWAGRFDAARSTLSAAARAAEGPATAFPRHEALGRLGLIDYLHGWPGHAESHARAAISEAEHSGLPTSARTGVAQLVLAAVAIDRGDLVAARDHLDQAAASSAASRDPIVAVELVLLRSRMRLMEGDPQGALQDLDAMAEKPLASAAPSPWVSDRIAMARAAVRLAEDDPRAAAQVFEDQPPNTPEGLVAEARAHLAAGSGERALGILDALSDDPGRGPAVTAWALLARAQAVDALGDAATAESLVGRALAVSRPHQLRRPFLEAGPWLGRLLSRRPALTRGHDWLVDAPEGRSPAQRPKQKSVVPSREPLSERELDVLERVAQLMSTEEVAADLHLSVNTVKTHLKSIYRKLAVSRRGEAVRQARELGLL